MLAKHIMRRKVITVDPRMTVREVARLFADRKISGAPVVDSKGALVGVVSQTDLLRTGRESGEKTTLSGFYHEDDAPGLHSRGFHVEDPDMTRVETVMTPAVLSADEGAPVQKIARLMLRRHVHRLVITRAGKLAGIVTSMDMLRALLSLSREASCLRTTSS